VNLYHISARVEGGQILVAVENLGSVERDGSTLIYEGGSIHDNFTGAVQVVSVGRGINGVASTYRMDRPNSDYCPSLVLAGQMAVMKAVADKYNACGFG